METREGREVNHRQAVAMAIPLLGFVGLMLIIVVGGTNSRYYPITLFGLFGYYARGWVEEWAKKGAKK